MIKKLLIAVALTLFLLQSVAIVSAAGIDITLKPQNMPGMPTPITDTEAKCNALNADGGSFYKWDGKNNICLGDEAAPINEVLQVFGGALLMVSGGLAVIVVAIGGIMYITSRGNQQQMEYAKNTLLYAAIGIFAITFSFFIVRFILEFITGV